MSDRYSAESWELIKQTGITHIVSVLPKQLDAPFASKGVKYLQLDGIVDKEEQDLMPYFDQSNEFIQQAMAENETNKVLVHC